MTTSFACYMTHSNKTAYDWQKKEWQKVCSVLVLLDGMVAMLKQSIGAFHFENCLYIAQLVVFPPFFNSLYRKNSSE